MMFRLVADTVKLISLIYGGDFNLFRPNLPRDHEEYQLGAVIQMFRYFGPFPASIEEIASQETACGILWMMEQIPNDKLTPFRWITKREVCAHDRDLILGIMKLDYRDRPTAKEVLAHEWCEEDQKDVPAA
jgi:hypothetical protein